MRRNTVKRLQSESGLNYLTDTLTSAWDAMRANFGVSQKSAAPHGWLTRHRWPFARPNILIFILACIFADPYCDSTFPESAAVHHPFYPFSSVSARIVGRRRGHLGIILAGGAQRGHTGTASTYINYPLWCPCVSPWVFTKMCKFTGREEGNLCESDQRRWPVCMRTPLIEGRCRRV